MPERVFRKSTLLHKSHSPKLPLNWINITIAGALLLIIAAFLYNFFFFLPVCVNEKWTKVPWGTTVQDIIVKEKLVLKRGDLKDTKGRLLRKGEGRPPGIFINGRQVLPKAVLSRGDRLAIRPGVDIAEEVERRVETVSPATYISGQGAFISVGSSGSSGMKIVNVGVRTGRIISEETIRPVKPVVLNRTTPNGRQVVALTFDDGPNPVYTPQILAILQSQQVPATFFVTGAQVRKNPDVLRQVKAAGYAVGNHSYSHALLGGAPASKVKAEIEATEQAIKETIGVGSCWFRPPGGSTSITLVEAASIEGCKTVLWTVDPLDWMRPPPQVICDRVLGQVQPGGVILLHDGGGDRSATVQALPKIIAELKLRGYSFVTLDEIVGNQ